MGSEMCIRDSSDRQRDNWDETLPLCLFAYRTSTHATTGFTPAAAVYGRELRVPLDFELEAVQGPDAPISEFIEQLSTNIRQTWETMMDHSAEQQQQQKANYDTRLRGPQHFDVGDLVMLSETTPRGQSRKLTRPWTGPWKIISRMGEATYQLKWRDGRRKYLVVHSCLLYTSPSPRDLSTSRMPSSA